MNELEALAGEILTENAPLEKSMTREEFSQYVVEQIKLIRDEKDSEKRSIRAFALQKAMDSANSVVATIRSSINSSATVKAFNIPVQTFVDADQHVWKTMMTLKPGSEPTSAPATNAFSTAPGAALSPKTNGAASEIKGATQVQGDSNFVENVSAVSQQKKPEPASVLPGGEDPTPSGQAFENPVSKEALETYTGDLNEIFGALPRRERTRNAKLSGSTVAA